MATSRVFSRVWLSPLDRDSRGPVQDLLIGGAVVGTMLLIMASGLGLNGTQLAPMTALPALGWAVMAVASLASSPASTGNRYAIALLIGLAAAAILLFCDPDGLLIQALDPILAWTFRATGVSLLVALVIGLGAIAASLSLSSYHPSRRWTNISAFLALALTGTYLLGGQAGFYGVRCRPCA